MYWKLSMLLTLVGCLCVILSCSLAPTPINSQTENQPLTAKAPAQEQAAAQKHSPEQKQNPAKQQDAIDHQSAGPEQKSVTKNQPPTEDDPGWILFRGDAKSTGVAKSALPEDLDVIWKYEVKQGAFMGTPIVVGGQPKTVYIGDADGKLFALAFDTGKLLWEFKTEIGYETAPAYKDGHIYIGDLDGVFYCLDTKGQLVWKYQTDGAIQSSANFYKDLVLFGSQDTKLYALDAKTGKKAWDLETADQVRAARRSSIAASSSPDVTVHCIRSTWTTGKRSIVSSSSRQPVSRRPFWATSRMSVPNRRVCLLSTGRRPWSNGISIPRDHLRHAAVQRSTRTMLYSARGSDVFIL